MSAGQATDAAALGFAERTDGSVAIKQGGQRLVGRVRFYVVRRGRLVRDVATRSGGGNSRIHVLICETGDKIRPCARSCQSTVLSRILVDGRGIRFNMERLHRVRT